MGLNAKLLALLLAPLAAGLLSLGALADTVDVIRVFEHHYPLIRLTADGRCISATPVGSSGKWYEVTYAYQGRIFREIIGYHPGKTLEVLASGKPQSVPYDNAD